MRSWFVSCFVLSIVAFLQACQARLPGPSGRTGPPGPIGRTGPPGPMLPKGTAPVKYCAISTKITTFLKQFRSVGLRGATGGGLRGRRGYSWVYNCLHAGLNFEQNIFELPTYHCCKKCEFPSFSQCMRNQRGTMAQDRCNSEALRCIARCINRKGGNGNAGRPGPPGPQKCPVKRVKTGNSYCLERSCLSV